MTGEELIGAFNAVAMRDQGKPLSLTMMRHLGVSAEEAQAVWMHVMKTAGATAGLSDESERSDARLFSEGLVAGLRLAKAART